MMAHVFKSSELFYRDYKWTAHPDDNPKVTGPPDSTLFNRHEGYEVLYLINHLPVSSQAEGQKAEKLIREKLPSTIRSQVDVKTWLKASM